MPFKTISVDLDAYRALKSAKRDAGESFSSVIKRVVDAPPARNFSQLLNQLQEFAGKGVFTAEERAGLRRRKRQSLRSRSRVKRSSHAS
jgi:predicted CopG family antitoxin